MKSITSALIFMGLILTLAGTADACTQPSADVVLRIPGIITHEGTQPYPCSRVLSACQEGPGVLSAVCPEGRYLINRVSPSQISVSPIARDSKVIIPH